MAKTTYGQMVGVCVAVKLKHDYYIKVTLDLHLGCVPGRTDLIRIRVLTSVNVLTKSLFHKVINAR